MTAAAEARQCFEWDQTCEIVATQFNVAAKRRVVSAAQLNPIRNKHRRNLKPLTGESLADTLPGDES